MRVYVDTYNSTFCGYYYIKVLQLCLNMVEIAFEIIGNACVVSFSLSSGKHHK